MSRIKIKNFLKGYKKEREDETINASAVLVDDFVLRRLQSNALDKWKNADAWDDDCNMDNSCASQKQTSSILQVNEGRRTRANISAASWHGSAVAKKTSRSPTRGDSSVGRRLGESKLLDMPATTPRPRRTNSGSGLSSLPRGSNKSLDVASSHETRKRESRPSYLDNVKYLNGPEKCEKRDSSCEQLRGQRLQKMHTTGSSGALTREGSRGRRPIKRATSFDPCKAPSPRRAQQKPSMKNSTWDDNDRQPKSSQNTPFPVGILKTSSTGLLTQEASRSKLMRPARSLDITTPSSQSDQDVLEETAHGSVKAMAEPRVSKVSSRKSIRKTKSFDPSVPPSSGRSQPKMRMRNESWDDKEDKGVLEDIAPVTRLRGYSSQTKLTSTAKVRGVGRSTSSKLQRPTRSMDPDKKSASDRRLPKRTSSESTKRRSNSASDVDDGDQPDPNCTVARSSSEGTLPPARDASRVEDSSVKAWNPSPQFLALQQILDKNERTLPADKRDLMMKSKRPVKKTLSAESGRRESALLCTSPFEDDKRDSTRLAEVCADLLPCLDKKRSVRRTISESTSRRSNGDVGRTSSSSTNLMAEATSSTTKPRSRNEHARRKTRPISRSPSTGIDISAKREEMPRACAA